MNEEAQILGNLLPTDPTLNPIIEAVRDKYKLNYVTPESEVIEEIYLGNEIIPLEEFRQDIENRVRENLSFFPPEVVALYQSAKSITVMEGIKDLDTQLIPKEIEEGINAIFKLMKNFMQPFYQILDAQIVNVANMLYEYILTGEAGEAPSDWFGKVAEFQMFGEPMIMALASGLTDPDDFVAQIKRQYKKTFNANRPRLTPKKVGASYYMQLRRLGKRWDFIFEEYIRLNKISLPRDRASKRYFEVRQKHERKLRRMIDSTKHHHKVRQISV
jgi:hypothetical protein